MSARISGLEPAVRSRVRAAFERHLARHEVAGGFDIPVSIKIIAGRQGR